MLPPDSKNRSRYFIVPEPALTPGVLPIGFGQHCISSHDYDWHGMRRGNDRFAIIQYTIRGRGALDFGGETLEVPPGSAMLLAVPEEHRYYLPEDSDYWEVLHANFAGDEARRIVLALRERRGAVVRLGENSPAMGMIAEQLLEAEGPGDNTAMCLGAVPETPKREYSRVSSAYTASALGYRVLMTLADELEYPRDREQLPEFLDRALEYCRSRLDRDISIDDMAGEAGCSRWHLARAFRRRFGVPPLTMVRELRMKLAFQLLRSEKMSVKETAMRCGFADTSYFVKVFRARYGFTPGTLRDKL